MKPVGLDIGAEMKAADLEILPDVFLVLVPLLLSELSYFVLQLDNGSLDLVVLTDQRHPAVENSRMSQERYIYSSRTEIQIHKLFKQHTLTPALAV